MSEHKKKDVTWEEPPPRRERYDWEAIAEQLRERPGEWARVFDNDLTSLATAIRLSGIAALRPVVSPTTGSARGARQPWGYEVRTTNNRRGSPRTCTLWLRYVPEDFEEESN